MPDATSRTLFEFASFDRQQATRFARDVLGKTTGYAPHMVAGVVLSGGASTRMGQPKALLPAGRATFVGRVPSFLERICSNFAQAGVSPVVVVTGRHDAEIRTHVAERQLLVTVVTNRDPARGQLSSLWCALDELAKLPTPVDAIVMTPVDHPWASTETVRRLVAAFEATRAPVVRPLSRDGTHGHPAIFSASIFESLRGADLDRGAKPVINALGDRIHHVLVDDPGAFADVDTLEDYERGLSLDISNRG